MQGTNLDSFESHRRLILKGTHKTLGDRGLTLLEVMIVVAIAGLLAVFGILQFQNYRVRSYNAAALSDLYNVQHQLAAYYSDNGQYPW